MTTLPQVYNAVDDLTPAEEQRLTELEDVIEQNFKGFVAVGNALAEIRDAGLYRVKGKTFEEYCQIIWEVNRVRAYQLIDSARVVANVKNFLQSADDEDLPLPVNDSQARELSKLPPEEQAEVWQRLVNLTRNTGSKITAKSVKKAVLSFKGKALVEGIEKSKKEIHENRTDFQSEAFSEAFDRFFDQLNEERNANWRFTSRKTVYRILQGLIDLVAEAVPGTLGEYGCIMELSEREKLKKAGFRIFRMDTKNKLIEEWHSSDSWNVLMECKTPKMLHDSFGQLLENHLHLRG